MNTIYIKEEILENINTYKAIKNLRGYSVDILNFAELKVVQSILKNTIALKDGSVKRTKKGMIYRDSYNEYIVEYNHITNILDFYTIKGVYLKDFQINKFLEKLDTHIELEK